MCDGAVAGEGQTEEGKNKDPERHRAQRPSAGPTIKRPGHRLIEIATGFAEQKRHRRHRDDEEYYTENDEGRTPTRCRNHRLCHLW